MKPVFFILLIVTVIGIIFGLSEARPVRLNVELAPQVLTKKEIVQLTGTSDKGMIDDRNIIEAGRAIVNRLVRNGFPLASIDSLKFGRDFDEEFAILYIDAGRELIGTSGAGESARISADYLEQTAASILDSLTDAGFPFASVTFHPHQPLATDEDLHLTLVTETDPGKFYRIGRIGFPGGEKSDVEYLRLESRLMIGDSFNRTKLESSILQLENLPSVSRVEQPVLRELSQGILDIDTPVTTTSSTRFSGIAAVSPGENKPTGQFSLEFGNLFRGGRSASFSWMGLDPEREGIRGSYREGWIGGLPLAVFGELESWRNTNSHSRTIWRLGTEWEPYSDVSLGLTGASERVVALVDEFESINSTTTWLKATVALSRLDSEWNPSSGYQFEIENNEGQRRFTNGSPMSRLHSTATRFSAARQLPKTARWIGFLRVENRTASGKGLLADEFPRFGGRTSVRGYREESRVGRNILFGALEIRFRPNRYAGFVGLTGDWGWIAHVHERLTNGERFIASVGLTSSFPTNIGTISLDLALPTGESFDHARLHLSVNGWL